MSAKPEQDEIVSEIHIKAPPERVFQALVDPKQVPQWWGQVGVHPELGKSYSGWPRMLGWLQALVERGETVDTREAG